MGEQIDVGTSAWLVDSGVVERELDTDASRGLTTAEAESPLNTIGPNRLKPKPRVAAWRKLLAQFADPWCICCSWRLRSRLQRGSSKGPKQFRSRRS